MEDANNQSLFAVDLSKSSFRGSGAMYQTDRLTIGRSGARFFIEGQEKVIEKIVYKENEESLLKADDLESKLNESLLRLLVVSVDHERMRNKVERISNQQGALSNQTNADIVHLNSEVSRLKQLLKDKDREIQFVKEAENRKSALQSGDLSLRLNILSQENKRLQSSNNEKVVAISRLSSENHKLVEQAEVGKRWVNFEAEKRHLEESLAASTAENGSLRSQMKFLESIMEQKLESRQKEVSMLKTTNSKMKEALDENSAMVANLQLKISHLPTSEQYEEQKSMCENLKYENETLKSSIESHVQEIARLGEELNRVGIFKPDYFGSCQDTDTPK